LSTSAGWEWGPIVGRILAEFGATVIRVESETRPDPLRTMPPFKDNKPGLNRSVFYTGPNCNKRSLALDLNNPKAREVARSSSPGATSWESRSARES